MSGEAALRSALREHGGALAEAAERSGQQPPAEPGPPPGEPGLSQRAAAGPRARGREAEYELLLEMIREGAHLHYGPQRVVRTEDPDLALLLGDQLYALGLARLAVLGDLAAISELADVISLVAQAHAASDPQLAEAVWDAGAVAIGWGESDEHVRAKELARSGDRGGAAALREAAGERRRS